MKRDGLRWTLCGLVIAVALAGNAAFGQEPPAAPSLTNLLAEAAVSLTRALAATDNNIAFNEFRQAIGRCEEAIRLQPDSFGAHFLMGSCLIEVVKRSAVGDQRRSLALTAREQFLIARRCPGADWRPYLLGSQFVMREMDNMVKTAADRAQLIRESRQALETGLGLATNTLVRAKFESELAACVLMESDIATDPAQQRAMSEQAIKLLQSSAAIQGADMPALLYDLWGVTLIKLGKLDNDPAKFQEAIERLHTCLTKEPGRLAARYNLACVYALIGRPDLAMTHLAVCIDGDPSRRFREAARKDPDLASVRNLPEFISLVAQPDSKVAIPLAKPGISNR